VSEFNPAAPTTFTDQQILGYLRECLVKIQVIGQSYTMPAMGRTFTRANLAEVQSLIQEYEQRIYEAANGWMGANVVFRDG
jgi:hypothetical protein